MTSRTHLIASSGLIGPVIALNGWHFFMEAWMYRCRIRALTQAKWNLDNTLPKADFDKLIPAHERWKADNYNHLFEQPTQFYAICLSLALLGSESKVDARLAWLYVGMRVMHSLIHVTTNPIMVRFRMFIGMSVVLATMTARAGNLLLNIL
jgi:hypothetical protein